MHTGLYSTLSTMLHKINFSQSPFSARTLLQSRTLYSRSPDFRTLTMTSYPDIILHVCSQLLQRNIENVPKFRLRSTSSLSFPTNAPRIIALKLDIILYSHASGNQVRLQINKQVNKLGNK